MRAKISTEKQTKKHMLIRSISEEAAIENEEEEVALESLVRLIASAEEVKEKSDQTQVVEDSASKDVAALASLQEQYAALQLSFQTSAKKLEEEMAKLTNKMTYQGPSQGLCPKLAASLATQTPEVTIRREFKINGQIGERSQRDKLSYSNLVHQIEMGRKRNHSKAEIIEAVVRSISPGLSLHDMLEIKMDLTLSQLRTILKGH